MAILPPRRIGARMFSGLRSCVGCIVGSIILFVLGIRYCFFHRSSKRSRSMKQETLLSPR